MSGTSSGASVLDDLGNLILAADTRWVLIAAAVLLVLIGFATWYRNRPLTTDGYVNLSLTLAQIYSAAAIFAVLVLTEPPALGKLDPFARRTAGFIAFIVLFLGAIKQVTGLFSQSKSAAGLKSDLETLANEVSALQGVSGEELKKNATALATRTRDLAARTSNLVAAAGKISGNDPNN